MRALCLLLIVCAACTKKPPAKAPAPPATPDAKAPADGAPTPDSTPVERKGDPCEGGEKPK